jgi:hypothetical protein
MIHTLFDDEFLEKKTTNRIKKYKPIPFNKYLILCEKEMIIDFLVKIAPFSIVPRRINNGSGKGQYESYVRFTDFIDMELCNELLLNEFDDKKSCAAVDWYMRSLECDFARMDYYICYNQITVYDNYHGWRAKNEYRQVKMTFQINNDVKKQITDDYNLNIGR